MSAKKSFRVGTVQWVFSIVSWFTVVTRAANKSRSNAQAFIKHDDYCENFTHSNVNITMKQNLNVLMFLSYWSP